MSYYRRRPVAIEAVHLTETVKIETLEGDMTGYPGDWLITGVLGEQYPRDAKIFEETCEPVGMDGLRSLSSS